MIQGKQSTAIDTMDWLAVFFCVFFGLAGWLVGWSAGWLVGMLVRWVNARPYSRESRSISSILKRSKCISFSISRFFELQLKNGPGLIS